MLDLATRQLTERGDAIVDQRTNSLIITDIQLGVDTAAELLESLDVAAPQVSIGARIVETTRDFSRELGIQWGFQGVADSTHGNTTGVVFPNSGRVQGHNLGGTGGLERGIGGTPFAVNPPVHGGQQRYCADPGERAGFVPTRRDAQRHGARGPWQGHLEPEGDGPE